MSRIGKKPVPLPKGVTATVDGQTVTVKGAKGELSVTLLDDVTVKLGDGGVEVAPRDDSKRARAMWGLSRSLVDNLVTGVANGFSKTLEISGVGYRAAMKGKALEVQVGFSHPVTVPATDGIEFETPTPTQIVVRGNDKQAVGETAAKIRKIRKPEPYKGKGIRYEGEYVRKKAGKAAKTGAA